MADEKDKYPKKISGGTLIEYLAWRGDLTFDQSPWIEIDGVIAAVISYANLGENELVFESGRTLRLSDLAEEDLLERYPQEGLGDSAKTRSRFLEALARSRRFQGITVLDQVNDLDPGRNIQFSATTMDVPGVGAVVAFRGTTPSLVGWKEDFMMSYVTPIPAQTAALAYLKRTAENTAGPLYLTGHSKGGNLALYSAAHTDPAVQDRLAAVYSFDGPGLDDDTIASEGYKRIEPLIRSFVPSGSVVGMLMNYYPKYRVVQSNSFSILQHDPFKWKMLGRFFLAAEKVSNASQILDQALHEWLKSCTAQQRELFVTVIFSLLAKKQSGEDAAEEENLLKNADEESKRMIRKMINKLIGIHAGISWDTNILKPLVRASDDFSQMVRGLRKDMVKSDVIRIDSRRGGFREAGDETLRMAEEGGLDREECLRLMLLTEEILSVADLVGGDLAADFWIERVDRRYDLHASTRTVVSRKQRRQLRKALTLRKSGSNCPFLKKLRGFFTRGEGPDPESVRFPLPDRREPSGEWRGYERSILFRMADDVQVSVVGGEFRMTVRKEFA